MMASLAMGSLTVVGAGVPRASHMGGASVGVVDRRGAAPEPSQAGIMTAGALLLVVFPPLARPGGALSQPVRSSATPSGSSSDLRALVDKVPSRELSGAPKLRVLKALWCEPGPIRSTGQFAAIAELAWGMVEKDRR